MSLIDPLINQNYRLNNIYSVVNKKGLKVPFQPNNVQSRLNQDSSKRRMVLKARQMGISTNELIRQLDFVLFNPNKTACIIAHEQDAVKKLFRIVRKAYEFLDDELKPRLDRGGGSKYEMFFPDINSRIYCDLESRGDTIHWLHISEFAFVKELDKILATIEAVPIDGKVTIESTANGLNHFYDWWQEQDTNYSKVFFPWYFHEEYEIDLHDLTKKELTNDEKKLIQYAKKTYNLDLTLGQIAFRRFKKKELKTMFEQEYPENETGCFLSSGESVFDMLNLKRLYDTAPKPIEVIDDIRIYKHKDSRANYIIGADTAEGVEGDASAAHVFDTTTREQVASFHSNRLKPSEFADKLKQIADLYTVKYPPPKIAVERNNHGHAVLLKLEEIIQYPHLYKHQKEEKRHWDEIKYGWVTDKVTRPLMLDTFIDGVDNHTIKLNDRETLGECLTLINNKGKIEATEGKHDDLVIAAAISIQLCIEAGALSIYDGIGSKIKI